MELRVRERFPRDNNLISRSSGAFSGKIITTMERGNPEVGGMWLEEVIGLQHQPRDKPINVKNEHDTSRLMEAYNMLNIPNESLQDYVQHIGSLPNNFY